MLKPEQLKSHRFISAGRGTYEAEDVDSFLREVSASYEKMRTISGVLCLPQSAWRTKFSARLSRARRSSSIPPKRERRSLFLRRRTEPMSLKQRLR